MRLSELFGCEVLDSEGRRVGKVHDARMVRDGPAQGAFGPAYRMQGLIVGAGSWGSRLGYDRGEVKGPWALKKLFQWFEGDAKFVDWAVVGGLRKGVIRLTLPVTQLPSVPRLRP